MRQAHPKSRMSRGDVLILVIGTLVTLAVVATYVR